MKKHCISIKKTVLFFSLLISCSFAHAAWYWENPRTVSSSGSESVFPKSVYSSSRTEAAVFWEQVDSSTKNIYISGSLTEDGSSWSTPNGALAGCSTLNEVILAQGITKIPNYICASYSQNSYIEAVYIPPSVQEIGNYAFYKCDQITIYCQDNSYAKQYAIDNEIPIIIFGDMLATGTQCINKQGDALYRLNLPASLSTGKQEIKSLIRNYNLKEFKGFGCPLLYEVHRKYPHMKKYSIQRILRETRSSALEPGEALDLIWSFYKTK